MIGDTIENLQSKMGYREYLMWNAYRNKYGPMNPLRMYDQSGAVVASTVANSVGNKTTPKDFMFYMRKDENEDEFVGEEEFIKALGSGVKIGR